MMKSIKSKRYDGRMRTLYQKSCKECNKKFWIPKHILNETNFCSSKCAQIARNTCIAIKCSLCSKQYKRPLSHIKTKTGLSFCSRSCKERASMYGGILKAKHYNNWSTRYRQRALKHFSNKCIICGYNKHIKMLEVDHIDGNRTNNKINNLQILCVWCHTLKTRDIKQHGPLAHLGERLLCMQEATGA